MLHITLGVKHPITGSTSSKVGSVPEPPRRRRPRREGSRRWIAGCIRSQSPVLGSGRSPGSASWMSPVYHPCLCSSWSDCPINTASFTRSSRCPPSLSSDCVSSSSPFPGVGAAQAAAGEVDAYSVTGPAKSRRQKLVARIENLRTEEGRKVREADRAWRVVMWEAGLGGRGVGTGHSGKRWENWWIQPCVPKDLVSQPPHCRRRSVCSTWIRNSSLEICGPQKKAPVRKMRCLKTETMAQRMSTIVCT